MNKYPILAENGDLLGYVSVDNEMSDAFAAHWEALSITPTVLRGYTATGDKNDQLIAFGLKVGQVQDV
jgi:hypothetical protein